MHEGVEMLFLMAPNKIEKLDGKKMIHCIKMVLGEPDRTGRRRPVPIEGSEEIIRSRYYYWCHWAKYKYSILVQ